MDANSADANNQPLLAEFHPVACHELPSLARFHFAVQGDKPLADDDLCFAAGSGRSRKFKKLAQLDRFFPHDNRPVAGNIDIFHAAHFIRGRRAVHSGEHRASMNKAANEENFALRVGEVKATLDSLRLTMDPADRWHHK